MTRPITTGFLFLLAWLLAAMPAQAQVERCVRTVAEFNSAWLVADSDPVVIKVATGTYDLAGSVVDEVVNVDDDVSILGGYNSSCTARSEDPAATVFTHGSGGRLLFRTYGSIAEGNGFLLFERLTFRGVGEVQLVVEDSGQPDESITLRQVWLDQSARIVTLASEEVQVSNSLFTRSGACALHIGRRNDSGGDPAPSYLERVNIRHSTFADNAGAGLCVGRAGQDEDDWQLALTGSVFWSNGGTDIVLTNPGVSSLDAVLRNNTYTALQSNRALRNAPVASSTANPQFVNAAAGNWRLSGASPAINSGRIDVNLLNQRDFDGGPRWFGDAPDRGAFESNVGSTATVLTVTNANDAGIGSLRQALIDANAAPNLNEIRFNISGACPRTITLASLLPDIVQPVRIDGYSQSGATRNTAVLGWNANLCIVLNGANQITGAYGFNVNTGASPDATVSIEGIAFSGHSFAAAQFVAGRDHRFVGNQIGGVVGTATLIASGTGIRIGGSVEGVRVGGPEPEVRNVIAGAFGIGVNVTGSGSTQPTLALIENNYIGTQSGGDLFGNQRGVLIAGTNHTVRNNVIANHSSNGIELSGQWATGNRVLGNRIGLPALCVGTCADRGNGGHGVLVRNSANGNRIEDNRIAYNALDGVTVTGAKEVSIRRNSSFSNVGVGIDLGDDGRNYTNNNNSQAAAADAGNEEQNYPSLSAAFGEVSEGRVSGTLQSRNGWYRIDFYASPSSACSNVNIGGIPLGLHGEARDWLGSSFLQISNGTASSDGTANFAQVPIFRNANSGDFSSDTRIITTATRLSANPNLLVFRDLGTSEFSRCRSYTPQALAPELFANGFE